MRPLFLLALALPLAAQSGDPQLDRYLTGLARGQWEARAAAVARIHTPAEVRARQRYIRERMTAEIGGFPDRTPLHARVTGTLDRDGYRVEKVLFESQPGFMVSANVYVPTTAKPPFAAVIGVAGHTKSGKADATYQHAWIGMAKRGFLVAAIDPPGQGERIALMGGTAEHTMMGIQCLLAGTNFARYEVWDGIRTFDYLLERGDVDPKRIAVAGNSGGGTQSAYLAVFEPRLAVAAPSCYITSWEKLWATQGPQDGEQCFTGFLKDGFDFGDFLIAFAPKPVQMSTAIRDFFPIDGARATYAEVKRIFDVMDAPGRAGYFEYDDKHGWSQPRREATYRWLEKWLHGREDAGAEAAIAVEPEKNLWCTSAGNAGGETVQSLNRQFAEALPRGKATPAAIGALLGVGARRGVPPLKDGLLETEPGIAVKLHLANEGGGRKAAILSIGGDEPAAGDALVASVEPRGWAVPKRHEKAPFNTLMRALFVGKTLAGMQVYDVLRAFDWLRAQPGVDPRRITLRGRGNGAVLALYAAALEPRIAAVEVSGGPASYLDIVRAKTHQGIESLVVPGVLRQFDLPDVAALLGKRLVRTDPAPAHAAATFTLEQAMAAPFPSELTAAPAGGKVAWVSYAKGVRNIMVAAPPAYQARAVTAYPADDGQEIGGLSWAPGADAIVYVRGNAANRAGDYPNPLSDPKGVEQDVWAVTLDGSAPRKLGEGNTPAVSPKGDRVVFLRRGQVWVAPLDGKQPAVPLFKARGSCLSPRWSPDGTKLAFESSRGDHAFIGVYDLETQALRFLDPGTGVDAAPEWSPDSRRVAFLRLVSGPRPIGPRRTAEPWSIRIADAATGNGREMFRAAAGRGSAFRFVNAPAPVMWMAGGRLVFPWERDGWTHLYSLAVSGGEPLLLTPGEFEVEDVAIAPGRRELYYSSNQDDIDRRHLWKVAVEGGAPVAVTSGQGIEWSPAVTSDGSLASLRGGARNPGQPVIQPVGGTARALEALPPEFPLAAMVTPQPVVFPGADGLPLHGQLFLPARKPGERAPALVFFHGGSRRQMLLGWHYMYYYHNAYAMNQYLASRGYVVLSVNYRSGTGYGLDFREAPDYGPSGGSEYNDVQGAGLYLRQRGDVDPARIGAWGGSYGGYLTAMALARASDLYAAGVDFHGVHDWSTDLGISPEGPAKLAFQSSPMAYLSGWRSPVLLIHGDDDRNVGFAQTVALANALRKQGVPLEELIFPDETHDFLVHEHWLHAYRATARFFDARLAKR
jgi:dipeptidyl aminopeptidase/acylaminoacyl peptidase